MPEFQRAEPNRQSWSIATIEADRPRQIEIDGMAVTRALHRLPVRRIAPDRSATRATATCCPSRPPRARGLRAWLALEFASR